MFEWSPLALILSLTAPLQAAPSAWYTLTTTSQVQDLYLSIPSSGQPTLNAVARLDGRPRLCRVDTASALILMPSSDPLAGHPVLRKQNTMGVSCQAEEEAVIGLDQAEFLGVHLERPEASLRKPGPGEATWIALGNAVFAGKSVLFDFEGQKLVSDPVLVQDAERSPLAVNSAGMPIIDVKFSGHPARAVWDSAADMTMIDRAFAAKAGVAYKVKDALNIYDSNGNTRVFQVVELGSINVGGKDLRAQRALLGDLGCLNLKGDPSLPLDAVLGLNTLLNADWAFDFKGRTWASRPAPRRLERWAAQRGSMGPSVQRTGRISDSAGILDPGRRQELEGVLETFCKDWWIEAKVVIQPSMGNWDLAEFAKEILAGTGVSRWRFNRAVVLVYALDKGEIQVEVRDYSNGHEVRDYFSPERIRAWLEPVRRDIDAGRHADVAEAAMLKIFRKESK